MRYGIHQMKPDNRPIKRTTKLAVVVGCFTVALAAAITWGLV